MGLEGSTNNAETSFKKTGVTLSCSAKSQNTNDGNLTHPPFVHRVHHKLPYLLLYSKKETFVNISIFFLSFKDEKMKVRTSRRCMGDTTVS